MLLSRRRVSAVHMLKLQLIDNAMPASAGVQDCLQEVCVWYPVHGCLKAPGSKQGKTSLTFWWPFESVPHLESHTYMICSYRDMYSMCHPPEQDCSSAVQQALLRGLLLCKGYYFMSCQCTWQIYLLEIGTDNSIGGDVVSQLVRGCQHGGAGLI